jgi:hypothetical protein
MTEDQMTVLIASSDCIDSSGPASALFYKQKQGASQKQLSSPLSKFSRLFLFRHPRPNLVNANVKNQFKKPEN